jgi:hypothetical protein
MIRQKGKRCCYPKGVLGPAPLKVIRKPWFPPPIRLFAEIYHMSLVVFWQVDAGDLLISFGLLDLIVE